MSDRIVGDDGVEKALDYLRNSAREIGDAKGEVIRTAHMIKVVKALEMKKHDGTAARAEAEALASDAYQKAILEDALAVAHYETMRALREAAVATIETWRSEQANLRSMKI